MSSLMVRAKSFFALILICGAVSIGWAASPQGGKPSPSLPIEFEPGAEEVGSRAQYLAHTQGLELTLREDAMVLRSARVKEAPLEFRFVGSDPRAEISPVEPTGGESNYLRGNDPSRWRTHVPHFRRVAYRNLYPGIDLEFYGNGSNLEHDFIVAPGADPARIHLEVRAPDAPLTVNSAGDIQVAFGGETLVLRKPEVYQLQGATREPVDGRFTVQGSAIGFSIGDYDKSRALVIDPALTVSTYLANLSLYVYNVAADSAGNTYVAGQAFDDTYPTTPGSFQPHCASCANQLPDVFVTKLNPQGTAQVFSTFLGGSDYEQPYGLAVDSKGNVVVAGFTQSLDFPVKTSIPHGSANVPTVYGFVTSFTPDGSALNYSSLLGGSKEQSSSSSTRIAALVLDVNGNAYVTGQTDADAFPVTALDCCTPPYPSFMIFVTKFLSTGKLGFSALVGDATPQTGGGGNPGIAAIQVGASGDAYIGGEAGSSWPITPGAYQTTLPTGWAVAPFITKLTADGKKVIYSTFLGNGSVTSLALDAAGDAWLTGTPGGPGFPVTKNAYQPIPPANNCCVPFFSKLSANGTALLYSSFFYGGVNGTGNSTASAIALDPSANVWLAGSTGDPQWPLVNPVQALPGTNYGGSSASTGFVSRFNPAGTNLTFSTYFSGPSQQTQIAGLALDSQGQAHISGFANYDLYTTPGAFVPTVTPPPPNYTYTYGFAAVLNPSTPSSAVCLAYPQNLGVYFGDVPVGTTSKLAVTISNCGTAALSISGFQLSVAGFNIPAGTNACLQPVAVGASCSFTIVFQPKSAGNFGGPLTITSNASVPTATINVAGTGAVPQIVTYQSSVAFDPQFLNVTSPQQTVVLMNNGNAPLSIHLPHTTIAGDFAYTQSGCGVALQPGSYCLFMLTFTPTMAGTRTGQLSIASNDPVTPFLNIALSGVGYAAYPKPVLTSVDLTTIPIGTTGVTVNLSGSLFFPASKAFINGLAQSSTYANGGDLIVTISPSLLKSLRQLDLTVVNPAPGGGSSGTLVLTTFRAVPLTVADFVYEPFSKQIYASIPASATQYANTIVPVNPATGTLGKPIPVGKDPGHVAVSDNGQYLYVATNGDYTIQRINLKTHAIERTFPLPVDPSFGQTFAEQIAVVPGSPQLLVVATFLSATSPPEDGIALYGDAGLVNWIANGGADLAFVSSFAFAGNPPVVYAIPFTIKSNFFQSYSVSPSGIQAISGGNSTGLEGGLLESDGSLLYVSDGSVWNPVTQTKLGAYTITPYGADGLLPYLPKKRTYILNDFANPGPAVLSYDQTTFQLQSSLPFPLTGNLIGLQHWGTQGFAVATGAYQPTQSGALILFKSSF